MLSQASCRFERPVANALEQFKQLKPTHEMFDSCRNCGALQEGHKNASQLQGDRAEAIKKLLAEFIERRWIEPSDSEWASPAFIVPKKEKGE